MALYHYEGEREPYQDQGKAHYCGPLGGKQVLEDGLSEGQPVVVIAVKNVRLHATSMH